MTLITESNSVHIHKKHTKKVMPETTHPGASKSHKSYDITKMQLDISHRNKNKFNPNKSIEKNISPKLYNKYMKSQDLNKFHLYNSHGYNESIIENINTQCNLNEVQEI